MEATESMTSTLNDRLIAPQKMGILITTMMTLGGAVGAIAALLIILVRQAGTTRTAKLQPTK